MDDTISKAFDSAQDVIKQLLTLSTAVVGAIVTFSGTGSAAILDFREAGWSVPLSVSIMLLSIITGFCALLNIIGALSNDTSPTPYKASIRLFAGLQILFFFVSISILGIFAPHWQWGSLKLW